MKTGPRLIPLAELEKRYIAQAYEKMDRNLTQTAKALGISLNTLKKKLPRQ